MPRRSRQRSKGVACGGFSFTSYKHVWFVFSYALLCLPNFGTPAFDSSVPKPDILKKKTWKMLTCFCRLCQLSDTINLTQHYFFSPFPLFRFVYSPVIILPPSCVSRSVWTCSLSEIRWFVLPAIASPCCPLMKTWVETFACICDTFTFRRAPYRDVMFIRFK